MYKSVSFNIFEENLEDIVYRDDPRFRKQKDDPAENAEKTTRNSTEIIIKPLVDRRSGRENQRK